MIYAALLALIGPSVTPLAKEFGFGDSLRMRDLKAVYYPIWRVDCVLQGRLGSEAESGSDEGEAGRNAWLAIREGYVPGENSF